MTKKRHSRFRVFASPKKKSRTDRSELPKTASFYGKAPRARVVRTRCSRRRERANGLGARRRRARRGLRGGRHARGPPAPDLDARAGRRRDGRGWKMSSRSRLAIFQRPRLLACDATDARPRPREDARRERRGRTKPDREERAVRDAAFRATTRAAREGSRRDAPPKPRVTTPRFPCARKAPVPRKFRRASAPETGHVGARDVPLVSVAGVRVRTPARVSGAALCDRP